jgi:hypothetical protein
MKNIRNSINEIRELKELLGLKDVRSIKIWCEQNEVPYFKLGAKTYVHSWTIEIAIYRQFQIDCINHGHDGESIVNAIINDDKLKLAELMDAPLDTKVKEEYSTKKAKSLDAIINSYKQAG